MNDEYSKLVAKVQHFFDLMNARTKEMEELLIAKSIDEIERASYREKKIEIQYLIYEFSKTFQNFLYQESDVK